MALRTRFMHLPIIEISPRQHRITQQQQIFGIPLARRFREIIRTRQNTLAIDNDHLVMRDRTARIDPERNTLINEKPGRKMDVPTDPK